MQERNAQPADVEIPSSQSVAETAGTRSFRVSRRMRRTSAFGHAVLARFPLVDGLALGPLHLLRVMVMRRGDGWIGGVVVAGAEKVGPIGSLV
jgi:hypothetical protein